MIREFNDIDCSRMSNSKASITISTDMGDIRKELRDVEMYCSDWRKELKVVGVIWDDCNSEFNEVDFILISLISASKLDDIVCIEDKIASKSDDIVSVNSPLEDINIASIPVDISLRDCISEFNATCMV